MRVAATVILYHPGEEIIGRIRSYAPGVEKIYLVDNTENNSTHKEFLLNGLHDLNLTYLHDGQNAGIAKRLNLACTLAVEEGFDWLLTMDQDSSFNSPALDVYLNCCKNYLDLKQVAQFGVEFLKQPENPEICQARDTRQLITSGSLLNLELYTLIGGFDEQLFIDQVDFDYCYRSIRKGYKIVQFQNIYLEHSLGKVSEHRSLKTLKPTRRSLHSPERLYYMVRNYLYVRKKYRSDFPEEIHSSKKDLLNRVKNNLLYGNDRWAVVKYILAGIRDHRRTKMGKFEK